MSYKEKFTEYIEYNPGDLTNKMVEERPREFDLVTLNHIKRTRNDISVLVWEVEEGKATGKQVDAWQKIGDSGSDPYVLGSVIDGLDEKQIDLLNETGPSNHFD